MKNKLFLSLGVVTAMFVTSCSNEELSVSSQEGLSQVRLSVAVGNEHATRAISDGKGVDKLVYAVFDEKSWSRRPRLATFLILQLVTQSYYL